MSATWRQPLKSKAPELSPRTEVYVENIGTGSFLFYKVNKMYNKMVWLGHILEAARDIWTICGLKEIENLKEEENEG